MNAPKRDDVADIDVQDPSDDDDNDVDDEQDGMDDDDDTGPAVDDLAFIAEHAAGGETWSFTADPSQGMVVVPDTAAADAAGGDDDDDEEECDDEDGDMAADDDPVSSSSDDDSTDSADVPPVTTAKGRYAALKGEATTWLTEEEEGNAPKGPPRTKHEVLHALASFAVPRAPATYSRCVLWQVDPAAVDVDVVDVGDPLVTYFDPSDLAGLAFSSSSSSSSSSS